MQCDPIWHVASRSSEMTCSGEQYRLTFNLTTTNLVLKKRVTENSEIVNNYCFQWLVSVYCRLTSHLYELRINPILPICRNESPCAIANILLAGAICIHIHVRAPKSIYTDRCVNLISKRLKVQSLKVMYSC